MKNFRRALLFGYASAALVGITGLALEWSSTLPAMSIGFNLAFFGAIITGLGKE